MCSTFMFTSMNQLRVMQGLGLGGLTVDRRPCLTVHRRMCV